MTHSMEVRRRAAMTRRSACVEVTASMSPPIAKAHEHTAGLPKESLAGAAGQRTKSPMAQGSDARTSPTLSGEIPRSTGNLPEIRRQRHSPLIGCSLEGRGRRGRRDPTAELRRQLEEPGDVRALARADHELAAGMDLHEGPGRKRQGAAHRSALVFVSGLE